jgi:hypothetical protein
MDILNLTYKNPCIIIPHRRYNLVSGEFRADKHERYLGSTEEKWNGKKVFDEAKFVHFSHWPVPKPWNHASEEVMASPEPKCKGGQEGVKPDSMDPDI